MTFIALVVQAARRCERKKEGEGAETGTAVNFDSRKFHLIQGWLSF